jgi:hypothetical protein
VGSRLDADRRASRERPVRKTVAFPESDVYLHVAHEGPVAGQIGSSGRVIGTLMTTRVSVVA